MGGKCDSTVQMCKTGSHLQTVTIDNRMPMRGRNAYPGTEYSELEVTRFRAPTVLRGLIEASVLSPG